MRGPEEVGRVKRGQPRAARAPRAGALLKDDLYYRDCERRTGQQTPWRTRLEAPKLTPAEQRPLDQGEGLSRMAEWVFGERHAAPR